MADKIMRMAGRGKDGTAKPLKMDNEGNVGVLNNSELHQEISTSIAASNNVTVQLTGVPHQNIGVTLQFSSSVEEVEVRVLPRTGGDALISRDLLKTYSGTSNFRIDFRMLTDQVDVVITNKGGDSITLHRGVVLGYNGALYRPQRELIYRKDIEIDGGESGQLPLINTIKEEIKLFSVGIRAVSSGDFTVNKVMRNEEETFLGRKIIGVGTGTQFVSDYQEAVAALFSPEIENETESTNTYDVSVWAVR